MTTCDRCGNPKADEALHCRDCTVAMLILHELERRHVGRAHPITRAQLEELTALPDRENRRIIAERLRDYGEPVAAAQGRPAGYYYPATDEEWDGLERLFTSRAMTCLRRRRRIRQARQEWEGQLTEPVLEWEAGQARIAVPA